VKPLRLRTSDWSDWHEEYDDPDSELAGRARGVQRLVAGVLADCPPGPITVISVCGGQGRELIGALAEHPRRADVSGRLVELDPDNAAYARRSAAAAHVDGLEIVNGDASVASAYQGLAPADLVVASGIFGHVDDDDQQRMIRSFRSLLRPGGAVVWTFFARARRRTERLRGYFTAGGYEEVSYEVLPGEEYQFSVVLSRLRAEPLPAPDDDRIFTFGSSHPKPEATEADA
jgi:SAM-dependent methyltransferase